MAIGDEEATLKLSVETRESEAALERFASKAQATGQTIEKTLGQSLARIERQAAVASKSFEKDLEARMASLAPQALVTGSALKDGLGDPLGVLGLKAKEAGGWISSATVPQLQAMAQSAMMAGVAVYAVVTAVDRAISAWVAFAARGDLVGDAMGALTTDISEASKRTSGMVSDFQLAIAANAAMEAGLNLTAEQFASVAVAAKKYADATGTDATAAMDRLVNAIVRGSARGLTPFGIHATDTAGAIEALTNRLGEAVIAAEGFSDKLDAAKNTWEKFSDALAAEQDSAAGRGLLGQTLDMFTQLAGGTDRFAFTLVQLKEAFGGALSGMGAFVESPDFLLYAQFVRDTAYLNSEDHTPAGPDQRPSLPRVSATTNRATDVMASYRFQRELARAAAATTGTESDPFTAPEAPTRTGRRGGTRAARPGDLAASLRAENESRIAALRAQEETNATNAIVAQRQREIDTDKALLSVEREMYEKSTLRIQAERSVLEEEWRINDEETRIAEERVARQKQMGDAVMEYAQVAGQAMGGWSSFAASIEEASIQRDANARLAKTADGEQRAKIEEQTQAKLLKVRQAAEVRQLLITAAVEAVASAVSFAFLNVPQGIMHASAAALALATAASLGGGAQSVGSGRASGGHTAGSLRGGAGGGEGGNVTNITVMLDAAGGVIQDSQLRRLGKYVSDANARGYINGRRAA